jgi:hypothetical protein
LEEAEEHQPRYSKLASVFGTAAALKQLACQFKGKIVL